MEVPGFAIACKPATPNALVVSAAPPASGLACRVRRCAATYSVVSGRRARGSVRLAGAGAAPTVEAAAPALLIGTERE